MRVRSWPKRLINSSDVSSLPERLIDCGAPLGTASSSEMSLNLKEAWEKSRVAGWRRSDGSATKCSGRSCAATFVGLTTASPVCVEKSAFAERSIERRYSSSLQSRRALASPVSVGTKKS